MKSQKFNIFPVNSHSNREMEAGYQLAVHTTNSKALRTVFAGFVVSGEVLRGFALSARALNLTTVRYEEYQNGNPMMSRHTNYDGPIFKLSGSYKF